MSLVETNWLEKNLDNVKIIDCSWHMPQTKRDGLQEYNEKHISKEILTSDLLTKFKIPSVGFGYRIILF